MSTTSEILQSMQSQYGTSTSTSSKSSSSGSDMGKDAFLELLVTQMQYQDPLNPQSNEDFLAQMAQFSALEQMQNLNTSSEMQQGYSLLGKEVIGLDSEDSTKYVHGYVESVKISSGDVFVTVSGVDMKLSDIQYVFDDETDSDTLSEISNLLASINDNTASSDNEDSEEDTEEEQ